MEINIDLEKKLYDDIRKRLGLDEQIAADDTAEDSPMFESAWNFGQQKGDYEYTVVASALALNY